MPYITPEQYQANKAYYDSQELYEFKYAVKWSFEREKLDITISEPILKLLLKEIKANPSLIIADEEVFLAHAGLLVNRVSVSPEEMIERNEALDRFMENFDLYLKGESFMPRETVHFSVKDMPSMITILNINRSIKHLFVIKNGRWFNPEDHFAQILKDMQRLHEVVADSVVPQIMKNYKDEIDKQLENAEGDDKQDNQDNLSLLYSLESYLKANYNPASAPTDAPLVDNQATATEEPTEAPTSDSIEVPDSVVSTEGIDWTDFDNLMHPRYKIIDSVTRESILDRLKADINIAVSTYDKGQITALALLIYESKLLHRNVKPSTFTKWRDLFCQIIGVPTNTYRKVDVRHIYDEFKEKTYHYIPFT